MEDLNAASLGDVKEWFKTYYGPSNAVLTVAGDVDPATVRKKVEKYFGEIPPGPPVAHQRVWVGQDERHAPRGAGGPGSASAHLPGVEHAGIRQRRWRFSRYGERRPFHGKDIAALQAPGL